MKLNKKSETSSKITFTYDKPVPEVEGYLYFANDIGVSRTFNPDDLEVTFGKVPSGKYAVEAIGFDVLDRADWPEVSVPEPPATGDLRWKPPGYPSYSGYERRTANTGAEKMDLDNSKDYVIDLGTKNWSSGSGRTIGLHINGGRNVVIIGGKLAFNSTTKTDDSIGVLIDVGADGGTVHLEGLDIAACNPITVRSRRAVQIENCRLTASVFNDDYSGGIHPDLVQCWGTTTGAGGHTPCEAIRMHKVSGFTTYTGLVCLIEIPPDRWPPGRPGHLGALGGRPAPEAQPQRLARRRQLRLPLLRPRRRNRHQRRPLLHLQGRDLRGAPNGWWRQLCARDRRHRDPQVIGRRPRPLLPLRDPLPVRRRCCTAHPTSPPVAPDGPTVAPTATT